LWLGRRQGRLKLGEVGKLVGGLDYAAVGQAVSRFGKRIAKDAKLRDEIRRLEQRL
jgi:chromosomal replication initiation ATPase DnaA